MNWDNEIIVITGGATGLGRTLTELLLIKHSGVRIAIIDVKDPDPTARDWMSPSGPFHNRLTWHTIDIRNSAAVKIIAHRITDETGRPTILINNAALPVHALPLVPTDHTAALTSQQAERTLLTNVMGAFNILSAFLSPLLSTVEQNPHTTGATIVTISSLLAHLNPARLADYNASKAALSSLHYTLTAEIARNPSPTIRATVKTILVEPGQLHTGLFADITSVPWYANFFGPVLEVNEIAGAIVGVLERGEGGVVRLPFYSKCMPIYGVVPGAVQWGMRWFSGIDGAIIGREGRRGKGS